MTKKIYAALFVLPFLCGQIAAAQTSPANDTYLKAAITLDPAIEIQKSTLFDASQSFIPGTDRGVKYEWDFGDGNRNEGIEVLHTYQTPGPYTVSLTVSDGIATSQQKLDVFAYTKLLVLITDHEEDQDRIEIIRDFAEKKGTFFKIIDSFGSSTEFISEEILTKKLTEEAQSLRKSKEIIVWTKENAGLNALSRFIRNNQQKSISDLSQKTILVIDQNVSGNISRIERQFPLLNPKQIIIAKEGAIEDLIESKNTADFIRIMKERGRNHEIITAQSGKLRPWNFMSYFVKLLTDKGIPDNTIALLLLLPVIATVVAFMRQVIGITTFGIYTPSIITLSFLIIGIYAGLLTLIIAIVIGTLARPLLRHVRMLFIPKMAIIITAVSLTLFLVLIISLQLGLFNSAFLSIAIFPMLILSTLVEKFVTGKSEKSYMSASVLMLETLVVAFVAYFIAGGEINLGFATLKLELVKRLLLNYPETIFLFVVFDVLLGKWTGLRVLERVRFREVLRHIEE
ncbi:PKD domain-containing protein [Candidatus Peregrinibacteria bacterium]|nr:PKD domain-containing protein [Candidatus Peregrinibacteria bacterium]